MSESFGWDSDEVCGFRSGLYKHYKGGLYSVICLVTHHETRRPMVLYVSHTYGGTNVRPLRGWAGDADGWLDEVEVGAGPGESQPPYVKKVPRFAYVGELPSDVKIVDRIRRCPAADSGGVQCELPSGHGGQHACPDALARFDTDRLRYPSQR